MIIARRGRPRVDGLTPARWRVLVCVREYLKTRGMPPSLQDIADATGRTPSAVKATLKRLEDSGYVECIPNLARGIVLRHKGKVAREPDHAA